MEDTIHLNLNETYNLRLNHDSFKDIMHDIN